MVRGQSIMLKNENIICISSIDWDFIWEGNKEIMSRLAEAGNRVLFIENTGVRVPKIRDIPRIKERLKNWFRGISGIRQLKHNLYVFSPIVLPFPYLRIGRRINRNFILSILEKWMKIMNFNNPVVWAFLPTPLSLDLIDDLNYKVLIYYCIDNFRVSSAAAKKIKNSEIKLMRKADLVFVTSKELYDYCLAYNRKVYFFPFAVNFQKFEKARFDKTSIPEELQNIKKPIIGYIGGIHKWVDLRLIKELCQAYPQYSFVFVGPIQTEVSLLSNFKNIYFLGKKEHNELPYFIKNFEVCVIPYLITDYTKNVYPTKLNEYHAMAKPVVSTDLPEIAYFNAENNNLVLVAKTNTEFINCISKAIDTAKDEKLMEQRVASALKNSWDRIIEQMSGLTEEVFAEKNKLSLDWKENFLRLYRTTRKKFLKFAFILSSIYLLMFYTPLFWYLASPLKISQLPKKADCIVVFAGGVGESGNAGQGYEERVGYAVELYKEGYARNLIFSSGYMYVFEEPLVMKALAVSLGVPENAIILEDRASGTYENVKFTEEILSKNGWEEILLVSSPYHMRRVALVFNKIAKNIKAKYVPIKNSFYYSHPNEDKFGKKFIKWIRLYQIKGILHEYLGILYYRWKGWI